MMNKLIVGMMLVLATTANANAKELELAVKSDSLYPMSISYQFIAGTDVLAQGNIKPIEANKLYYIYVNRVADEKDVLVKINKMSIPNVAVFNDPCEIMLTGNHVMASITVGFQGDPDPLHHNGEFTCTVSAT